MGVNGWWPNEDIQFSHFTDNDDHPDLPIAISGAILSADRPMMRPIIFSLADRTNRQTDTLNPCSHVDVRT
jgi:hypothetical protein